MDKYFMVAMGGALGSLARYALGAAVISRFPSRFPFATLIVNVTGCFLIGAIMPLLARSHANWRLLLVVGFLGGYTTFSAFAFETYVSVRGGSPWIGLANVVASVTLG